MRGVDRKKDTAAGLALLSWCVTCATLDSMILYNRPRTRGEVADFSAAAYGRLYVIMIFSGRLYVSHVRPSYHIRTSARGRADVLTIGRGLDRMTGGQLRTLTRETGRTAADRRGTRWGRDGGEASPRADLAGGWGLLHQTRPTGRRSAPTDRRTLHYMVEIAAGCGAIMPQIMPRGSCSRRQSQHYIG